MLGGLCRLNNNVQKNYFKKNKLKGINKIEERISNVLIF